MDSSSFSPMEPRTLRENVTDLLRQQIITGRLAPGTELNQAQIAEQLGISRGPVREALGKLEQEGLIRNVPYKGVHVTPLTEEYVEELYSLRSALETFALRRGIEDVKPDDLERLSQTIDAMRHAAQMRDAEELVRLDLQFHRIIVQMADHELLLQTWEPLELGVQRCLHARHRIYDSMEEVVGTHPALVEAIGNRDVDLACEILHEHIIEAGEQVCRYWHAQEEQMVE